MVIVRDRSGRHLVYRFIFVNGQLGDRWSFLHFICAMWVGWVGYMDIKLWIYTKRMGWKAHKKKNLVIVIIFQFFVGGCWVLVNSGQMDMCTFLCTIWVGWIDLMAIQLRIYTHRGGWKTCKKRVLVLLIFYWILVAASWALRPCVSRVNAF